MNYLRTLSALIILAGCWVPSRAQSPFEKNYPTVYDRTVRDMLRTPDGGYILCGMTNVSEYTECDLLVTRTDGEGNELAGWPKTYGKAGKYKVDYAYSMVETTDGNYFIVGYSASFSTGGDVDMYLLKISPDGTPLMEKTFGSVGNDEAREIIKTSDGNYVIVGTTNDGVNQQVNLIKIDNTGTPVFNRQFGTSAREFGLAVQEAPDGGFIMTGQTFATDAEGDTYIVKADAGGNFVWEKTYGELLGDEGVGLVVNSDNSFVVAIRDSTASGDYENIDVRVRNFNADGSAGAYNRSFGGSSKDTPKCITRSKDGHLLVGAISRSWNWRGNSCNGCPDMWLLKLDATTLDTMWTRNFGSHDHDHLHRAKPDPVDDAILLAGHQVTQPYVKKVYFLKVNRDGLLQGFVGINDNGVLASGSMYPNPSAGVFGIQFQSNLQDVRLHVTDILGNSIYTADKIQLTQGEAYSLDLSDKQPGVYLVTVESGKSRYTGKLIKQ